VVDHGWVDVRSATLYSIQEIADGV